MYVYFSVMRHVQFQLYVHFYTMEYLENAKHCFWIVIFLLTELFYIVYLLFTFWVVIRQEFTSLAIYFVISIISTCWYIKCSMLCNIGFVVADITLHGTRNTIVWLDVFSRIKKMTLFNLVWKQAIPSKYSLLLRYCPDANRASKL